MPLNGILQREALTSMLRRLGPAGGGLVPSGMAWALAPQAGSFLPGSLPRLPCTSIGALFRTNWLSGMRNELLSVLSVGDSPSSGKETPAVLLMDLLRLEGMLEIACKRRDVDMGKLCKTTKTEASVGHESLSAHAGTRLKATLTNPQQAEQPTRCKSCHKEHAVRHALQLQLWHIWGWQIH